MRLKHLVASLLPIVLLVTATACGGGGDEKEGLAGEEPCGPAPAATTKTDLPAKFPELESVIYTDSTAQGPSTQVVGYASTTIDKMFDELKKALDKGAYDVTKDEKEDHDAEVNFSSDDDDVTGQVAISEECRGRLHVRIIVRPRS